MGTVCSTGIGVNALWNAARSGKSGVGKIIFERTEQSQVKIAAQVKDFKAQEYIEPALLELCDPFSQMAIIAADEAFSQARLSRDQSLGPRTGVIVGTGIGGYTTIEELIYTYYVRKTRTNLMTIPRAMSNAAASQISMRYGCNGPTFAVSSACSSANQAIGLGVLLIRSDVIDRAIVGGSEAGITPAVMRAWENLRVLTPDFCRPFSKGRKGMVLGEGAGIFILENAEIANKRGAPILAEIAGYGTSSDALDLVRPDAQGAAAAMRLALNDADLTPDAIDYVNAHGTGTIANDVVETEAMREVFGQHIANLAISSTKPIHGHALGAAGALELIITVMALRENIAPPTINWIERDPKCDLEPVPNQSRQLNIRAAMSNSFAFGGINACLIVTGTR
jgi:nodulation protein E